MTATGDCRLIAWRRDNSQMPLRRYPNVCSIHHDIMRSLFSSKFSKKQSAQDSSSWEHNAVLLNRDDASDYNEENILPVSPEKLSEIRKWLQPTAYSDERSEYKKHSSSHLHNTGNWLLESSSYKEWHESEHQGILWIKGIPGSGKSVVAANIIDILRKEKVPVLYFFFRQIIDANHVPQAALRDWLDQILSYSPPLQAKLAQYLEEFRSLQSLAAPDFWALLKLGMLYLPRVYCAVDALDEIDHGQDMVNFLEGLSKLGVWRPAQVKIVMTSRPVPSVEIPLRHAQTLVLRLEERMVDRDIATFVQYMLKSSQIEDQCHESIKQAVPGRANGLFLYARLAMDAFLEPGADPQRVLSELPTDLNVMYDDLLREHTRRTGVSPDLQLLILQSVTHASRPLRLLELSDMINVTQKHDEARDLKQAKELVRTACGPLLEILPDETISVIHHSLTEFLKGSTRNLTDHNYPILEPGLTHQRLALACLSYLQSGCFNDIPSPVKPASGQRGQDPKSDHGNVFRRNNEYHTLPAFTKYAAENWYVHIRKSMLAGFNQSEINAALDKFFAGQDFPKWSKTARIGCQQVTPLFVSVTLGLSNYSEVLLARTETNPNQGDMYEPPLYNAAKNGYDDIAYQLVSNGADLNEWDRDGYRALHIAAMNNHSKVVDVLLRAGADPLCTPQHVGNFYDHGLEPSGTPVSKACKYGHVETVTVLLPYLKTEKAVDEALFSAANPNNQLRPQTTLLSVACRGRDSKTIKILLEAGADPNTRIPGNSYYPRVSAEDPGYTAIHALAKSSRTGTGGIYGGDPSASVLEETIEAFELLIRAGADVHHVDGDGDNALDHASDGVTARILLDAGVSPYHVHKREGNLLHRHFNLDVLRHLLERAEINTSQKLTYWESTPLLKSLKDGHVEKALLLLEFGADVTGSDRDGNGAFHLAVGINYNDRNKGLQKSLFTQLREAGADVSMRNNSGHTPLHTLDFRNFNEELLHLLMEAGLDTEAKDNNGETFLFSALRGVSDYEFQRLCDKLVAAGCNINSVDNKGRNLLHVLKLSDVKTLQYLVEKGVNPMQTDNEGNTLWHVASDTQFFNNEASLFQKLKDLGIDPQQPNHTGRTPLHMFSSMRPKALDSYAFKNVSPIKIEKSTPFDTFMGYITQKDPVDMNGVSPLHLASTFSEYLTKRLLSVGADPFRRTAEGLTVFHLASRSRQPNILGVLFEFCKHAKSDRELEVTLNARDELGRTALFYACASGCVHSVNMLIEAGAIVDSDTYDGSIWQGCVEFEDEHKNWTCTYRADSREYDWSARRAGGVTIADTNRPDVREAYHNSTGFKHRIDEIVELFTGYETSTRNFVHIALQDAVSRESEYAVECLANLQARLYLPISDELQNQVNACLLRREQRASKNPNAMAALMDRSFDLAAKRLTDSDFLNFDSSKVPFLHPLVHHGFVSILQKVLKPETAQKLDDATWRSEQEKSSGRYRSRGIQPLLLTACQSDLPNMDMIRFLVEQMGVDLNPQTIEDEQTGSQPEGDKNPETALHYLVRGMNWWQTRQALPYLISKGAKLNLKDKDEVTPLRASLDRLGSVLFDKYPIEILVRAGADVNSVKAEHWRRSSSCLSRASSDADITRFLLDHGAVITHTDIRNVIASGYSDTLKLFLAHGSDPNSRDTLGPQFEEDLSYSKADKKALRAEAKYPLHFLATIKNMPDTHEEMVNILLEHGADVNARYEDTTLMHCAMKNSPIARLLLVRPELNLEATDSEGRTLLLAASQEQEKTQYVHTLHDTNVSLVRLLLDRGANIRARDHKGRNVLHSMLYDHETTFNGSYYPRQVHPRDVDHPYIAALAPFLVHERDNEGNTPLHCAAKKKIKLLTSLLDAGGDPRIENNKGDTALHYLVRGDWMINVDGEVTGLRRLLFERFLALGANIHARNHRGETPIFNFFLIEGYPQSGVAADETFPEEQRRPHRDGPPCSEESLYNYLENMGVKWTDLDMEDQSLLHIVAQVTPYRNFETSVGRFQFLMSKGLDVAAEDKKGRTPLDIAAAFGNTKVLDLFKKEALGGES
ncbi:unnamed protein product [Periconia digitata]|uniref:Nephrocystin 3-like N-terminal domain-containing protein n=1 Tax=Periconia digitata TaxID=1303443 RepID=A0A9W4UKN2_9PLEO|nr:unnamed protein product [Periconia digitata]